MNFSKEQKDYIIHALEHCEVLTGGRSSGKTLELIKQQEKEIERLNNIINDLLDRQNEALRYIGNHLSLDSRYKHGNGDEELILVRKILNKHIKELKGVDKQ